MFETLGQFKILDRIGAGGMGEIYRARDTRLGRTVAIRVVAAELAGDPDRRERFLRDARATAALSHPNIAALYEIGEDQGQLFLVFEFVPGVTLKNVVAGRPLHPRRAVDFAAQIGDALAEAHAHGIVHRDIKPDNIIITPKDKAKVLDFGLATWTAGGAERERAADDPAAVMALPGHSTTMAYLSPEQALGERFDHRTDIFSLGIVLFEMLTGKLPFTGKTAADLALEIAQATPVPASTINRAVPPELDAVLAKALAKSLDRRYELAAMMTAELFSVAATLGARMEVSESSSAPPTRAAQPQRRRSYLTWLLVAVLLLSAMAGAWLERETIQRFWRRTIGPSPTPVLVVTPRRLAWTDPPQTGLRKG
jgi:serine/threonine protein kinase